MEVDAILLVDKYGRRFERDIGYAEEVTKDVDNGLKRDKERMRQEAWTAEVYGRYFLLMLLLPLLLDILLLRSRSTSDFREKREGRGRPGI